MSTPTYPPPSEWPAEVLARLWDAIRNAPDAVRDRHGNYCYRPATDEEIEAAGRSGVRAGLRQLGIEPREAGR